MDELVLGRGAGGPFAVPLDALTRHAVCLGATGSGKTALCLALLEEAALRGVPVIAVDPKGDVANLLLTFPGLPDGAFEPWVDGRALREAGGDRGLAASREAARWRAGLAASQVPVERLGELRRRVDFALFTPGSDAGEPLSLLGDLARPPEGPPEALRERSQSAASALLALAGVEAEAGRSREHGLLAALLAGAWSAGQGYDLAGLIGAVQTPPFASLGVLDIESYFPKNQRFELVLALNHLLSSPGALLSGAPLSIPALLASPSGKPRVSVVSVAHLADHERQAFVTSLLGHLIAWMRSQPGSSGLRALLFLDEAAGYLPPVANPPTKGPFLTLFKQGRSQGLGVVVATQNPADLDYKALSNAGTWLVGRLATARDRLRVREALEGSEAAGPAGDDLDATLASLSPRQFLCRSAWGDPQVFESRWTLSYLRGPLALAELRGLAISMEALDIAPLAPGPGGEARGGEARAPLLPPEVGQLFAPGGEAPRYEPRALALVRLGYHDRPAGVDEALPLALAAALPAGPLAVDWAGAERVGLGADSFEASPAEGASFGEIPAGSVSARSLRAWKQALLAHLAQGEERRFWRCEAAGLASGPDEDEAAFRGRLGPALARAAEAELAALQRSWAPRRKAADERVRRAEQALARQKERSARAQADALLAAGAALLGGLLGARGTGKKAVKVVKDATRVKHAGNEVERADDDVAAARRERDLLVAEQARSEAELRARLTPAAVPLEALSLRPARGRVEVVFLGLGWLCEERSLSRPTGGLQASSCLFCAWWDAFFQRGSGCDRCHGGMTSEGCAPSRSAAGGQGGTLSVPPGGPPAPPSPPSQRSTSRCREVGGEG